MFRLEENFISPLIKKWKRKHKNKNFKLWFMMDRASDYSTTEEETRGLLLLLI